MSGEFYKMDQITVQEIAQLGFARGKVGERHPLNSDEQKLDFAQELAGQTAEITKPNTADCGDERLTIALEDGTNDREMLDARVTPQLFGGIGLAATKAMIAADAVAIQDAENVWDAYLKVSALLAELGYEDAGHQGCGASLSVKGSVENAIPLDVLVPSIGLLAGDDSQNESLVQANVATKQRQLEAGFYDGWSNSDHEQHLKENYPQNFSYLLEDKYDHETHGHNGSAVYAVTQPGHGFIKNGKAFSVTVPFMEELANKLGGSDEERRRIMLGFADDTLHVGAGIVTKNIPVFAETA